MKTNKRVVYKHIPNEVYKMIRLMDSENYTHLSKLVNNFYTDKLDFISIKSKWFSNEYKVTKFTQLGNKYEFSLFYKKEKEDEFDFDFDLTKNHYRRKIQLRNYCYVEDSELDNVSDYEYECYLNKFKMILTKHNLDLNEIKCL